MMLVSAARDYLTKMLQDISGMKVLILDSQTVSIVSVVYSQSDLLQKEVFLVEMLDSASKESMSHLKAVYFIRPISENIQHLRRQLASPRFGEYHLFFSNIMKDTQIHILADSDEQEVVQQVQEFYADFCAIDPYHFTLNFPLNHIYMLPAVVDPSNSQKFCDRVVDGIAAVFLALKRRPVIRYQRTSDVAKRIAQEASKLMYERESGLFDFRRTEISPLLLVVDRRDDPVTPLLNQWTYQAMVHELIGIQDNKVDLRNIGKIPKDQQEVVLSSEQDAFFKANMYENFGDLGMNIKRMVDEFQQIAKSNQNIQTIEDMAKFVDNYPEYRKKHGNVSKHVTMVTELSKIVEERKLMLVSQTEQELACNGGQVAAFEAVMNLLNNESISDVDRLRLVMLYALRYEEEMSSSSMVRELQHELETKANDLSKLQKDISKNHQVRKKYTIQLGENELVLKELDLLNDDANVFKLIGPVLVKQDLAEANANVRKRIEYISAELKRLDGTLQDLEDKQNGKKESILKLQQKMQALQAGKAKV